MAQQAVARDPVGHDGVGGHRRGFAATLRRDAWWFEPLWTGLGFLLFTIYVNWEMFQGSHFWIGGQGYGGYLSPFYSPLIFVDPTKPGVPGVEHALLGASPAWWPWWFPSASAAFILPFPLAVRATCYYYRKFYYRAYFMSPPACAVNAVRLPGRYEGERVLLLFQNLHRYAVYMAIVFLVLLSYDAFMAFFRDGKLGVGVGTIILLINPILLGAWTFGCHAWRHLVGGKADCFSCDRFDAEKGRTGGYKRWTLTTWLNERHMLFAWVSMVWVAFAGIYVRLVSMGIVHDYNTWGH